MLIGRNEDTLKFSRLNRFIIDDPETLNEHKLAYQLTKPLMVGQSYNNEGVFGFVLQEVVSTDDDNLELNIADYYKHFPTPAIPPETPGTNPDGKKVWL